MHYFEVSVCFGWKGLFLTLTCVTVFTMRIVIASLRYHKRDGHENGA